jgi:hypothetical protein
MDLILFETAVIAITVDDDVLIALFDGDIGSITNSRCVALLSCQKETAASLTQSLGSALKPQNLQDDVEN